MSFLKQRIGLRDKYFIQFFMVEIAAPFQSGANDVSLTNCKFLKMISNPVSDVRSLTENEMFLLRLMNSSTQIFKNGHK